MSNIAVAREVKERREDLDHVVVFIPGIMGSCLEGGIWDADILETIEKLTKNPGLIKLSASSRDSANESSQDAAYDILNEVYLSVFHLPPFKRERLYDRLRRELQKCAEAEQFAYIEFPYDWRQSVVKTFRSFGKWLGEDI